MQSAQHNSPVGILKSPVRAVVVDIETLYPIYASWNTYGVDLSPDMLLEEGCLLSWSGTVYGEDSIQADIMTPKEAKGRDSYRVVDSLYRFLETAHIGIGHNSTDFDFKLANTYFLDYRFPPVKFQKIDTFQILRKHFKLPYNRLAYVNKRFGIREKMPNEGFGLWRKCAEGDQEALDTMLKYNIEDVLATSELFTLVYPWADNLPSFSPYAPQGEKSVCSCGSEDLEPAGEWRLNLGVYEKYRCKNCGSLVRGRKNLMPVDQRKQLLVKL
jgi:hypothetical protein